MGELQRRQIRSRVARGAVTGAAMALTLALSACDVPRAGDLGSVTPPGDPVEEVTASEIPATPDQPAAGAPGHRGAGSRATR